jgi:pimeloyl-ACP methyl ester carboxylesterase
MTILRCGIALCAAAWLMAAQPADELSRMVDAGGYKVRMRIEGRGRPIVFISGGFGGRFESWSPVSQKLVGAAQVILYDRGGSGGSEPAPGPRDSMRIASELRTALQSAKVKGPYVIVGQSLGGIHARVFAHEYPQDVAGLVLIDPTAEDYGSELIKARGEATGREAVAADTAMADEMKKAPEGFRLEYESLNADFREAREAWPLPKIPITVMTSLHPGADLNHESPMLWLALHRDFAARAGARHVVTEKYGHNMQNEDSDFVAKEIRELLGR